MKEQEIRKLWKSKKGGNWKNIVNQKKVGNQEKQEIRKSSK